MAKASSSEALAVVAEREEATATRARRRVVVRKLCMVVVKLRAQKERSGAGENRREWRRDTRWEVGEGSE